MPICTLQLKRFRTDSPTLTLPSVNSQGTEWKTTFTPRRVCQALPPADHTTPGGLNSVLALLVRSNLEKMGHIWKQAIKRVRPGHMSSPWRNWYLLSQRQVTDTGHQDVLQTPHSAVSWKSGQLCLTAHPDQGVGSRVWQVPIQNKAKHSNNRATEKWVGFFWLHYTAHRIWIPWLRIESGPQHWSSESWPLDSQGIPKNEYLTSAYNSPRTLLSFLHMHYFLSPLEELSWVASSPFSGWAEQKLKEKVLTTGTHSSWPEEEIHYFLSGHPSNWQPH